MNRIKLRPVRREYKLSSGTRIAIEVNIPPEEIPNNTPLILWVAFRGKRGGATIPFSDFPAVKTVMSNAFRNSVQDFLPTKPGTYTAILVAKIDRKPVTYRGVPIHVVRH